MKVFENKFIAMYLNKELSSLDHYWTGNSISMKEQDYKDIMNEIVKQVEHNSLKHLMSDARLFAYAIAPSLQEWTNENFFAKLLDLKLRKYAILLTTDFIAQLSIEQTIEEDKGQALPIQYFDDELKAKEWLKK